MDGKIDGGPAFPEIHIKGGDNYKPPTRVYYPGMTLRDWFAGQYLIGLAHPRVTLNQEEIARECYSQADAMLAERVRKEAKE